MGASLVLLDFLKLAIRLGASDLHVAARSLPWFRIKGVLQKYDQGAVFNETEFEEQILALFNKTDQDYLKKHLELDVAYMLPSQDRFRVNVFYKSNKLAAVFRLIPNKILSLAELKLPKILQEFAVLKNGLVLITGATGSGKTTTLASVVDFINTHQAKHIITIEDPIEFLHQNKKSLISQREVGRDTKSFSNALRAALREDPDVILVGEMRDLETIRLALAAAETGHLVLATLHTASAAKTVTRIGEVFSGSEQSLIRTMLADSLRAVVTQMLVPNEGGGNLKVATEIMVVTPAIANLIRENKIAQIYAQIQTGAAFGMHTLEQDLKKL